MAKKIIKKAQMIGESFPSGPPKRTKEVVVSPSGDYRTTNRTRSNPNSYTESSRTRRTIQGALKGVPKVNMNNPPLNNNATPPSTPPVDSSYMKKGGVIKQGGGSNKLDPTKAINTFKKNASMKKGGTTKIAGVMKSGGTKYQSKGAVVAAVKAVDNANKNGAYAAASPSSKNSALTNNMVKGVMAINAAAKEAKLEASRPKMMKKIVKIKR